MLFPFWTRKTWTIMKTRLKISLKKMKKSLEIKSLNMAIMQSLPWFSNEKWKNRVAEVEKFELDFLTQKKIILPKQSGYRNSEWDTKWHIFTLNCGCNFPVCSQEVRWTATGAADFIKPGFPLHSCSLSHVVSVSI